jgi:hypothetical protein
MARMRARRPSLANKVGLIGYTWPMRHACSLRDFSISCGAVMKVQSQCGLLLAWARKGSWVSRTFALSAPTQSMRWILGAPLACGGLKICFQGGDPALCVGRLQGNG